MWTAGEALYGPLWEGNKIIGSFSEQREHSSMYVLQRKQAGEREGVKMQEEKANYR